GFFYLPNGYGRNPGRGRGLDLRAFLTGGVSNRSEFYDESRDEWEALFMFRPWWAGAYSIQSLEDALE
ncbi:MAG: hypothetical protein LBF51_08195, partial [Zoogloeaceae bacterium]|nr:hypothetical protein [Zoogloeaceae bacterium]